MRKLKNILMALCLCVCVGFGCFALTGCSDGTTNDELASLKSQVEELQQENSTLETENQTLKNNNNSLETENETLKDSNSLLEAENSVNKRDRAFAKLYEAFVFTADEENVNATFSGVYTTLDSDFLTALPNCILYYKELDLGLGKVYKLSMGAQENLFVVEEKENSIIYCSITTSDGQNSFQQLTLTLDGKDNITNIEYISKTNWKNISDVYYKYYEANYVVNSNTPFDGNNTDTFEIKTIVYNSSNNSNVEEFMQVGGTYSNYKSDATYNITELTQFNAGVSVNGELTVNESFNQEQANAQLETMKTHYDISGYVVEEIDLSSIIG